MQTGAFEYPDAYYDELDFWALWNDLDTIGYRTDYAPGDSGNVCCDVEEVDRAGQQEHGRYLVTEHGIFELPE